jgi:hypothetical protein
MFEYLAPVFNVASFSDKVILLILVDKLVIGVIKKDYNNQMRYTEFVAHVVQLLRKGLISELKCRSMLVCC